MKKHILLRGERGVGKSTLIRRLLEASDLQPGGFYTKMDKNPGELMHPIYIYPAALPEAARKRGEENLVGRCGEQVLKNNPNCISIFICGNPQFKLGRIMEKLNLDTEQAIEEIKSVDRSRKNYHNYYCDTKWGDAQGYDMTVKSDVLGCEKTAQMLTAYIRAFMQEE